MDTISCGSIQTSLFFWLLLMNNIWSVCCLNFPALMKRSYHSLEFVHADGIQEKMIRLDIVCFHRILWMGHGKHKEKRPGRKNLCQFLSGKTGHINIQEYKIASCFMRIV